MITPFYSIGLCGFGPLFGSWLVEQFQLTSSVRVTIADPQPQVFANCAEELDLVFLQMKSMTELPILKFFSKQTGLPVIVWWLGPPRADEEIIRLMNAGASAVLSDQHDLEDICRAVADVAEHNIHLNNIITTALYGYCRKAEVIRSSPRTGKHFSEREIRMIELKKSGMTSKKIGEALFLSKKTVENIFYNIYRRFDCRNFFELVSIFEKEGPLKDPVCPEKSVVVIQQFRPE